MCMYVCMYVCVHVCVCMCVCVCVHVEPEINIDIFFNHSYFIFETKSLIEPGTY